MMKALLILNETADPAHVMEQVGALVRVTQQLPPRLALVDGDESRVELVRRLPGVLAICLEAVDSSILGQLSAAEQAFVEAWAATRQPEPGRPGDGLPWDAEGFQPPDRHRPKR